MGPSSGIDKISLIIILRSLFLYELLHNGWTIKKYKDNTFEIYKSVKKTI